MRPQPIYQQPRHSLEVFSFLWSIEKGLLVFLGTQRNIRSCLHIEDLLMSFQKPSYIATLLRCPHPKWWAIWRNRTSGRSSFSVPVHLLKENVVPKVWKNCVPTSFSENNKEALAAFAWVLEFVSCVKCNNIQGNVWHAWMKELSKNDKLRQALQAVSVWHRNWPKQHTFLGLFSEDISSSDNFSHHESHHIIRDLQEII